ncbi:MAG: hypothetical protein AMXMBFR66_21580 [Pseudomonadota bacterium]|nr:DUF3016 domain-containing protein [Rubrivivax sp.]
MSPIPRPQVGHGRAATRGSRPPRPRVWAALVAVLAALAAALALVFVTPPARAAGTAVVNFVHAERYTDIGRTSAERERTLEVLADHVQALAARLPAGQTLGVDVLDVKLAGEQDPLVFDDARVLRNRADWPRMTLRWHLDGAGGTLARGEDRLAAPDYFFGTLGRDAGRELPYEKRMLDAWFAEKVLPASRR